VALSVAKHCPMLLAAAQRLDHTSTGGERGAVFHFRSAGIAADTPQKHKKTSHLWVFIH